MKKLLIFFVAAICLGIESFNTSSTSIPIGSPLPKPEVKIQDISGKVLSLKDALQPDGLLVMFSCNTCPVVHRYQQRTREICNYALSKKLGVVLLNSNEGYRDNGDSFEDMKGYAKDQQYKWYYAVDKDNELADAFGANRTPECFLFDKQGKLVYKGAIDDNPQDPDGVSNKYLRVAIDDMMAGKDIAVKETRSVGCSIKRK